MTSISPLLPPGSPWVSRVYCSCVVAKNRQSRLKVQDRWSTAHSPFPDPPFLMSSLFLFFSFLFLFFLCFPRRSAGLPDAQPDPAAGECVAADTKITANQPQWQDCDRLADNPSQLCRGHHHRQAVDIVLGFSPYCAGLLFFFPPVFLINIFDLVHITL